MYSCLPLTVANKSKQILCVTIWKFFPGENTITLSWHKSVNVNAYAFVNELHALRGVCWKRIHGNVFLVFLHLQSEMALSCFRLTYCLLVIVKVRVLILWRLSSVYLPVDQIESNKAMYVLRQSITFSVSYLMTRVYHTDKFPSVRNTLRNPRIYILLYNIMKKIIKFGYRNMTHYGFLSRCALFAGKYSPK